MHKTHPYQLKDAATIASPALLIYRDLVISNIDEMIRMAGSPTRLMPHVKTHKMGSIVQLQVIKGITRFKCATIAEAAMVASSGAEDVVIAYQLNKPSITELAALIRQYPSVRFASLVDNMASARLLDDMLRPHIAEVYIDVDSGMHRTGIVPDKVPALYAQLSQLSYIRCRGLHAYDGHIRTTDISLRKQECDAAFAPVEALAKQLNAEELIAGGTPSFPVHTMREGVICSPGTTLLWDEGYRRTLPDEHFTPAAILLTRVISKPREGHITLDLGHKAVSAENPITQRVFFPELSSYEVVGQSEEHLVVRSSDADHLDVGDVLYGIPWHVCPTVALYNEALIIQDGRHVDTWAIARGRKVPGMDPR